MRTKRPNTLLMARVASSGASVSKKPSVSRKKGTDAISTDYRASKIGDKIKKTWSRKVSKAEK